MARARQLIFDVLRNCLVYYEHQSLMTSIYCSFNLADSNWPIHEKILFALAYGIGMWRQVRRIQAGKFAGY